jgi:hypothetical protein
VEDSLLNADLAATPAIADPGARDPGADVRARRRKQRTRAVLAASKEIDHGPEGPEPQSDRPLHKLDSFA